MAEISCASQPQPMTSSSAHHGHSGTSMSIETENALVTPIREPESHHAPEELTTVPNTSSVIASQDSTQQKDNAISDPSESVKRAQGEDQKAPEHHDVASSEDTVAPEQGAKKGGRDAASLTGETTFGWLREHDKRLDDLEKEKKEAKEKQQQKSAETFMFQTIPEVQYCNWEHFKNRFSPNEPPCAIQALVQGSTLDADIEEEQLRRVKEEEREKITRFEVPRKASKASDQSSLERIERVRINSAILLGFLAKVTGETQWRGRPHTFVKPFGVLIHFHGKMEDEFSRLEEKFGTGLTHQQPNTEDETTSGLEGNKTDTYENLQQHTESGSHKAYAELKCYIELMKERIMPGYHAFDHMTPETDKPLKVRFDDLWSIFRPGEIVYEPGDSKSDVGKKDTHKGEDSEDVSPHKQRKAPAVWRVYFYLSNLDTLWEVENLDEENGELWQNMEPDGNASISVYYIDYDGKSYSPVSRDFKIKYYAGEKDIKSLPIYPLRFAADGAETVKQYKERGTKFREVVSQHSESHIPQSYEGWTLTHSPLGFQLEDHTGTKLRPEHIDGDVVVDFHEAYQMHPWWRPYFDVYNTHDWSTETEVDEFAICHWKDKERTELLGVTLEVVVAAENINQLDWNEFVAKDKFMARKVTDKEAKSNDESGPELTEDDLCLLPARIFVYGLRERKFANVDIRFLKAVSAAENPFDQLQISSKHKDLILSSVFEHLDRKEVQRKAAKQDRKIMHQDFIPRKGRGLVVLLHGAPGVGKTATAEAVSYAYRKPLFPITCGDLGIEPQTVESNLSEIFRLANLWDCILLFDEAEIFLSRREKRDDNLQRNALVSIFLRTLEYYSGILFLTTNRVGAMDEAVKSRVHLSLYYPYLGKEETETLFLMNIDRLRFIEKERAEVLYGDESRAMFIETEAILDFAKHHFKTYESQPDTRWNGRQIRNAFQIASSLARYEHRRNPHRGLFLSKSHFTQVEEATKEFDEYRLDMLGKPDGEIARDMQERAPVAKPR